MLITAHILVAWFLASASSNFHFLELMYMYFIAITLAMTELSGKPSVRKLALL